MTTKGTLFPRYVAARRKLYAAEDARRCAKIELQNVVGDLLRIVGQADRSGKREELYALIRSMDEASEPMAELEFKIHSWILANGTF